MTASQFATAIGIVESGQNALTWGDFAGSPFLPRAMGRFQIWAAEFQTWAPRLNIVAEVNETWDSVVQRLLEAFYPFHTAQGLTDVEVAMTWHRGHEVKPSDPEWDTAYAEKFARAVASLTP